MQNITYLLHNIFEKKISVSRLRSAKSSYVATV